MSEEFNFAPTDYVLYRSGTGEILTVISIAGSQDLEAVQVAANVAAYGPDCAALRGHSGDSQTQYVQSLNDEPVIANKPPMPIVLDKTEIAAGGTDYATLTGLPDPCEIIVDDPDPTVETTVYTVEGGGFEFEAQTPGLYTIEVRRFPFLPLKVEITAT